MMIKCIEDFEVTLTPHLAHPFYIMDLNLFTFTQAENLTRALKPQYPKKDPHLIPKSGMITLKTDENPTYGYTFC